MKKRFLFPLTLLFTIVLTTAPVRGDWQKVHSSPRNGYVVDMAIRNNINAKYLYWVQQKWNSSRELTNQWIVRMNLENYDENLRSKGLTTSKAVRAIAVRPDGAEIVVGMDQSQVNDYKSDLGFHGIYDSPGSEYPLSLAYSRDGTRLAAGTDENVILIWRTSNRAHTRTLRGHTGDVRAVAWSPKTNNVFASGSDDGTVRLWNPNNGVNYAILRGHTQKINDVAFSLDGEILASAGAEGKVILWNVETPREIRRISSGSGSFSLAWHPDGETLFLGRYEVVQLFNPNNGTRKQILGHPSKPSPGGGSTSAAIRSIALHRNGVILASADTTRGNLFLWEPSDRLDVTGNGTVNINDLVEVARNYGKTVAGGANAKADVNNDGRVDIKDITLVARRINSSFAAPSVVQELPNLPFNAADVQQWIEDAKRNGIDVQGIAVLEQLLEVLLQSETVPLETALLANYPNPFNPETWIPYQLAKPAKVTVSIHSADGKLVRTLALGQLPAGAYQDKDRAAYWDGKNEQGEAVASGIYFYTLKAGDFAATKKMLIRK